MVPLVFNHPLALGLTRLYFGGTGVAQLWHKGDPRPKDIHPDIQIKTVTHKCIVVTGGSSSSRPSAQRWGRSNPWALGEEVTAGGGQQQAGIAAARRNGLSSTPALREMLGRERGTASHPQSSKACGPSKHFSQSFRSSPCIVIPVGSQDQWSRNAHNAHVGVAALMFKCWFLASQYKAPEVKLVQ